MNSMQNIGRKAAIDGSKYVNVDTGEQLADVFNGNVTSVNIKTGFVRITYAEYSYFNLRALEYLSTKFSNVEMGRILALCRMIKATEYNALYSKTTNKPHTKKTLIKELGVHINTFEPFMKKLIDNSVIYLMSGMVKRKKVVTFILNPTLACQNRNFPRERTALFENFDNKMLKTPSEKTIEQFEQNKIEQ